MSGDGLSSFENRFNKIAAEENEKIKSLMSDLKDSKKIFKQLDLQRVQTDEKIRDIESSSSTTKKDLLLAKEKVLGCSLELEKAQERIKKLGESIKQWTDKTTKESQDMVDWVQHWGSKVTFLRNQVKEMSEEHGRKNVTKELKNLTEETDKLKSTLYRLKLQKDEEEVRRDNLVRVMREGDRDSFLLRPEAKKAISITGNLAEAFGKKNLQKEEDLAKEIRQLQKWATENNVKF